MTRNLQPNFSQEKDYSLYDQLEGEWDDEPSKLMEAVDKYSLTAFALIVGLLGTVLLGNAVRWLCERR